MYKQLLILELLLADIIQSQIDFSMLMILLPFTVLASNNKDTLNTQ